jgi:hypothetical protein
MGFDGKNVATTEPNQAPTEVQMRAIVQDGYGSAEVLRSARIDRPRSPSTRCCCGCTRPVWIGGPGT